MLVVFIFIIKNMVQDNLLKIAILQIELCKFEFFKNISNFIMRWEILSDQQKLHEVHLQIF